MKLSYTDKTKVKIILLFTMTIIGLPLWFLIEQPTIWEVLFWFMFCRFVTRVANIGYHRWLTHQQFEPSWLGRKLMLWFMVITAEAPPGHYVVSHLQHHANTDKEGDPHGPKQIGFWRLFWGEYDEVKPRVNFLKYYAKQKDAQFVTNHYWKLYFLNLIILASINMWSIVWLSFMFSWSWLQMLHINWRGHGGVKGTPANLGLISNILIGGENYHKNHHDKPRRLIYGKWDTTGKYLVPLLR